MSRNFYVVSVPLVVLRNYVVSAPTADEALATLVRAPGDWFGRAMHSERFIGVYETLGGVPMKATALSELADNFDAGPDMGSVS